jgi:hypothetical protein
MVGAASASRPTVRKESFMGSLEGAVARDERVKTRRIVVHGRRMSGRLLRGWLKLEVKHRESAWQPDLQIDLYLALEGAATRKEIPGRWTL